MEIISLSFGRTLTDVKLIEHSHTVSSVFIPLTMAQILALPNVQIYIVYNVEEHANTRCKQVCIECISDKVILYSTGNCGQYPVIKHNRKEYEK